VSTVILRTTTRIVIPLMLVVSAALFVQGHNQPGGGFIAGVLTATAFALIYITYGMAFLETDVFGRNVEAMSEHIRHGIVRDYHRLFSVGLLLAVLAGLTPLLVGLPFLTQTFRIVHHIPLYHEVELASAVVFDLGVYAVVVGSLLTILSVVGAE